MPGYQVDVIDLGFFLEEMLELGLETEEFTRKKNLQATLHLTDIERDYFQGRKVGRTQWIAQRVELNAMRPRQRLEYLERKLKEHGADTKVIPPDDIIEKEIKSVYDNGIKSLIKDEIELLLDIPALVRKAMKHFSEPPFSPDRVKSLTCKTAESWKGVARHVADTLAYERIQQVDWDVLIPPEMRVAEDGDVPFERRS